MRGAAGVMDAARFLMDHLNFFSFLVYFTAFCVFRTVALFCVIGEGEESGTNRKEKAFKRSVRTDMDCSAGSSSTASDLDCFWNNQCRAPDLMEAYTRMMETSGVTEYSVMWCVSTLILPPLTEEIIFRGLIHAVCLPWRSAFCRGKHHSGGLLRNLSSEYSSGSLCGSAWNDSGISGEKIRNACSSDVHAFML